MDVGFNSNISNITNNSRVANKTAMKTQSQPSFSGSQGLSREQAEALKAQHIAAQNMRNSKIPNITEKDINLQVTCVGCSNMTGNTREIDDCRVLMDKCYGYKWNNNFYVPHIIRNGNGDEKRNGESTALIIPLNQDTKGIRGGDNAAILFNGNISNEMMKELVNYMIDTGILKHEVLGTAKKQWCYLNSVNPKRFFENTNIRTVLANFFRKKQLEEAQTLQAAQEKKVSQLPPVKDSDINIKHSKNHQDKNNTREVKDYTNNFNKNGQNFTVGYSTIEENGVKKDMTIILVPAKNVAGDFITITIDNRKLSKQQCQDMINYLVYNNAGNSESDLFKKAIVNYLNLI